MAFPKITDEMRAGKGNVGQPDTPGLTTPEMQAVMDELANLCIDFVNSHIDELGAETAAGNIGASVPVGVTANPNIGSVLSALSVLIKECTDVKHSHSNKSTLDAITSTTKEGYDALVQLLNGIENVQLAMTESDAAIPTSNAVISYIDDVDISQKAFEATYPIGTVFQTTASVDPATLFGYGTWTQLGTVDQYGISRYERRG